MPRARGGASPAKAGRVSPRRVLSALPCYRSAAWRAADRDGGGSRRRSTSRARRGSPTALGLHPLAARVLASRGLAEPADAEAFLAAPPRRPPRPVRDEGDGRRGRADRAARSRRASGSRSTATTTWTASPRPRCSPGSCAPAAPTSSRTCPTGSSRATGSTPPRSRSSPPQGARLLVTLDCGITSAPEVRAAAALGVDAVVVDHHTVPVELPAAAAILNPHQPGCGYPSKDLAAVGVTFTLAMALRRALRERGRFGADASGAEPEGRARPRRARHGRGRRAARRREPDPRPLGARGAREEPSPRRARAEAGRRGRRGGGGHGGSGRVPARAAHQRGRPARRRRPRRAAPPRAGRGRAPTRSRASSTARTRRGRRSSGPSSRRRSTTRRSGWAPGRAGSSSRATAGTPAWSASSRRASSSASTGPPCSSRSARRRGRGAAAPSRASTCTTRSRPARGTSRASAATGTRPASPSSASALGAFREAFEAHALAHVREEDLVPRCRIEGWVEEREISERAALDLAQLGPYGAGHPEPVFALRGAAAQGADGRRGRRAPQARARAARRDRLRDGRPARACAGARSRPPSRSGSTSGTARAGSSSSSATCGRWPEPPGRRAATRRPSAPSSRRTATPELRELRDVHPLGLPLEPAAAARRAEVVRLALVLEACRASSSTTGFPQIGSIDTPPVVHRLPHAQREDRHAGVPGAPTRAWRGPAMESSERLDA